MNQLPADIAGVLDARIAIRLDRFLSLHQKRAAPHVMVSGVFTAGLPAGHIRKASMTDPFPPITSIAGKGVFLMGKMIPVRAVG